MKKVLILAYDFPPYVSVGGIRPYNWFKHLKEFDVEPIVVTRQWGNVYGNGLDYIAPSETKEAVIEDLAYGKIIRTPYNPNLSNRLLLKYGEDRFRILRKSISAYYEFAQYFFITGPKKELYFTARKYLKNNSVDAIIATGDPFVLFTFAAKLSKEFGTPWIADYRDLWSQYGDVERHFFLKYFHRNVEQKTMRSVNQIFTVSSFLNSKIRSLGIEKKFQILPNGFDDDLIQQVSKFLPNRNVLCIALAGTIYAWHPWKSFVAVYCVFLLDNPNVKIHFNFYGVNIEEEIQDYIRENFPDAISYFSFTQRIPNREVLQRLASNHVMLLFNYYSYMGTKIFDYLGIQRKIVLCYSNDEEANALKEKYYAIEEIEGISQTLQADLIQETNSGIVVENSAHLKMVLQDLWDEFENTQDIKCDSINVEKHSRKEQVKKLAAIIHQLD